MESRRLFVCLLPVLAVAAAFWVFDLDTINKHHVLVTSVVGVAVGLPLLMWRTMVARDQLNASNRIADTANKNRTDSIFATGANMLGEDSPETRWAGINTLIRLVDENPEYMNDVVMSLCAFMRPESESPTRATPTKSNEQKLRVLDAINRWGKKRPNSIDDAELDLQGMLVEKARLDSICLTNVNLSEAYILDSAMKRVDFSGGKFSKHQYGFRCIRSSFHGCKFDGAFLAGADIRGVDFTCCTFDGADISDIQLNNAGLSEGGRQLVVTRAQLEKAYWDLERPPKINLAVVDADTREPLKLRHPSERTENEPEN